MKKVNIYYRDEHGEKKHAQTNYVTALDLVADPYRAINALVKHGLTVKRPILTVIQCERL